ncbi:MAG: hypothetical protein LBC60_01280 [Spirochaetaceae bacterium]|nr:hypothetical protein [Spirochaetaceae bacterium]
MKRLSITGFALCAVLLVLGFSGCDAALDPSNSGDSGLSKPPGELTITGVGSGTYTVYVFSSAYDGLDSQQIANSIWVARAIYQGTSPVKLIGINNSTWSGSGPYYVFLVGSQDNKPGVFKSQVNFDKGRGAVTFSSSQFIFDPEPEDEE